jgi:hypothetical protein
MLHRRVPRRDPRSVMALEDQLVVHVLHSLGVHAFELDGGQLAPANRPGPKHVPDDYAVAVSIEATPEAAHRNHDQQRRQEQKE